MTVQDNEFRETFKEKLQEAKGYILKGEPFWCDDFTRPTDQLFAKYLRENGFDIMYLYFVESWEGVYFIKGYELERLRATSIKRAELRDAGISDELLPSSIES